MAEPQASTLAGDRTRQRRLVRAAHERGLADPTWQLTARRREWMLRWPGVLSF